MSRPEVLRPGKDIQGVRVVFVGNVRQKKETNGRRMKVYCDQDDSV